VLDQQGQRYPEVSAESDVSALKTRVVGALAAHGDPDAAKRVKADAAQGIQSCDREDMEVRAEALSALVQADPAAASAVLRRILSRRDQCTVPLRRRAVYLLAREGAAGGITDLLQVAKNDPDASVRADAVGRLAQIPGDSTVRALEQLLAGSNDEHIQRAAVQALRHSDNPEAGRILRRVIEREDLPEEVRAEAIRSLARRGCCGPFVVRINGQVGTPRRNEPGLTEGDASYLRSLYDKTTSRSLKATILETLAGSGGGSTDQWLMSIVRNPNEDLRSRVAALSRLRRSDAPVEELAKLYDALSERELRYSLIGMLGEREEPAATDKLIEIARAGTDPALRRSAIGALARKKDPRTTKLLLELVEKEK